MKSLAIVAFCILAANAAPGSPQEANAALDALEATSPLDASTMQMVSPDPHAEDVTDAIKALGENNPEDAAIAIQGLGKRQGQDEDLASILAALKANSPDDAAAAQDVAEPDDKKKRDEEMDSILAALSANSPDDAKAAQEAVEPDD